MQQALFEVIGKDYAHSVALSIHKLRSVKPGWLARNGFVLLYLPAEAQEKLIKEIAPKKRRHSKWTHVVDHEALSALPASSPMIDNFHHPALLNDLAVLGYDGIVLAGCGPCGVDDRYALLSLLEKHNPRNFWVRVSRRRKRRFLSLTLLAKPNGMGCWVRVDQLARELLQSSEQLLIPALRALVPSEAWTRIDNELHFDEIRLDPLKP